MTRPLGLLLVAGFVLVSCSNDPPVADLDTGAPLDAARPGLDASEEEADTGTPVVADASTLPGLDAAQPVGDTGIDPGLDAAQPVGDTGLAPGLDAAQPVADTGTLPGLDASQPGLDAGQPGLDAGQPGLDAGQPGLDASQSAYDAGPFTGPIVDLRADNNRNGTIDLTDPSEDLDEDTWTATHGAIFLANIDDDQSTCVATMNTADSQISKCNDAADTIVNGPADLLDLARLKTVPWPGAPADAQGTLSLGTSGSTYARLFLNQGGTTFAVFNPDTDTLSATQLRAGVEIALEGKDVVRNSTVWDGYLEVTLTVTGSGMSPTSDKVRMREAPMLTRHHLEAPQRVYAAFFSDTDSTAFTGDLQTALSAAGVSTPLYDLNVDDQWAQDYFETAYMAMPGPGGTLQSMHVNVRSANVNYPSTAANRFRPAGKVVFARLRGPDTAAVQYGVFDASEDTLNSFGNLETIPPYSYNGQSYPLGRIFRGSTASYHPDTAMLKMFESQQVQSPLYVDTEFLLVGHVDETITFLKANNARGWTIAIADPALARTMLQQQQAAGNGTVQMFVGMKWLNSNWSETPAAISINSVLNNTAIMASSAAVTAGVATQLAILKAQTGITDAEILHLPILFQDVDGWAVAYMVGTANGISLGDAHYGMPKTHGPVINGSDIFRVQAEAEFATLGIGIHWVENWNLYHRLDGEVHCGSNTTRVIPTNVRWWESGL